MGDIESNQVFFEPVRKRPSERRSQRRPCQRAQGREADAASDRSKQ
jgi:hypothetical protein